MKPSQLGVIANFTIGNAITIPITKYNASYSDTLNIYVGNTWVKMVQGIVNNDTVTFTSAELLTIYDAMPTVTAATFRFVLTTYNGGTIVGTSEKGAMGSITMGVKPTISDVSLVEGITAITTKFGGYVQYQSRIICTTTATAGMGSSIYSYNGNVGTFVVMGNPVTTNVLTVSGTNNYSITVTDQRGRTSDATAGTFNVLAYDTPKINNFSVIRCNSNGTEDLYGSYVKINASAEISSVNNLNDKSFKVQYKLRSATTWTDLLTYSSSYVYTVTNSVQSGFSVDEAYDFRLLVADYFTTIERDLNISAGFAIIDFKADGKGLGLGTLSTKQALQIGYEIYDRFDTRIRNGLAIYESGGATDVNTTLEELVLSTNNTPTSGFWYVRTMFYGTKSATTNRTQVAYPYNTDSPIYYRYYFNGGWSNWKAGDIKEITIEDGSGYLWFSNGFLIQWGRVSITPTANVVKATTIYFDKVYDYQPKVEAIPNIGNPTIVTTSVGGGTTLAASLESMVIYMTRTTAVATTFQWSAIGWKG